VANISTPTSRFLVLLLAAALVATALVATVVTVAED
jgi:hypothetical protein